MPASRTRYHLAAIILHWVMAVCFLLMLTSGLVMAEIELPKSLKFQMFQWHKSLGVLLLCALMLRVLIRLCAHVPEFPAHISRVERVLAKLGHAALYLFMLIIPISGWVMVSSSPFGLPTIVFGWFEWPHIPGISANKEISDMASEAHEALAYGFIALILGHVGAVIKHAVIDHENLLPRMGIGKMGKK